jgi:hypothetical protein
VTFEDSDLEQLTAIDEIEVETHSKAGDVHRTIVWPLVRDGVVYLRSFHGPAGRWYREAVVDPGIALVIDGRRVPARAVPAADDASVEACSAALREKYRRSYSLQAMLAAATLPTTLRIEPAPVREPASALASATVREPAPVREPASAPTSATVREPAPVGEPAPAGRKGR